MNSVIEEFFMVGPNNVDSSAGDTPWYLGKQDNKSQDEPKKSAPSMTGKDWELSAMGGASKKGAPGKKEETSGIDLSKVLGSGFLQGDNLAPPKASVASTAKGGADASEQPWWLNPQGAETPVQEDKTPARFGPNADGATGAGSQFGTPVEEAPRLDAEIRPDKKTDKPKEPIGTPVAEVPLTDSRLQELFSRHIRKVLWDAPLSDPKATAMKFNKLPWDQAYEGYYEHNNLLHNAERDRKALSKQISLVKPVHEAYKFDIVSGGPVLIAATELVLEKGTEDLKKLLKKAEDGGTETEQKFWEEVALALKKTVAEVTQADATDIVTKELTQRYPQQPSS